MSIGTRWLVAVAVSISLHLAAIALLTTFISSRDVYSSRLAGVAGTPLVVRIGKMGRSRASPAPSSHRQSLPEFMDAASGEGARSSSRFALRARYFPAAELDVIPKIRRDIDLYPEELRGLAHGSGKAVLRLWIDETGHVVKVEAVSSDLPAIFAEVAARSFRQADFLPGRKDGFAVKSKVEAVLFYPPHDSGQ